MLVASSNAISERKITDAKTNRVMERRWRDGVDLRFEGLGRRKEVASVALFFLEGIG